MNSFPMAFGGLQPIVDAPVWVVMLLKITAILCSAWAAHLVLKWTNPRWRVILWRATAVGLVVLPVTAWLLPALKIHVQQAQPIKEAVIATPDVPPARTEAMNDPDGLYDNPSAPSTTRLSPIPMSDTPNMDAIGSSASARRNAVAPAADKSSMFKWLALLLAAWLSGIAVLVIRLIVGHYRIQLIVRHAEQPAQWVRDEAVRVAEAVGCRSRFEMLQSANVSSPFLCGFMRPRLLLPAGMGEDSYRRDLPGILAHELSHIRSRDVFWNYGLQLITIVLWFHPLSWRMRHVHLAACELVCDAASADFVGNVSDYCRTLARVAVDVCSSLPAAGIAMARTSAIGSRLSALKRRVFHLPLRRRSVIAFGLAALLTVTVVGTLQFALALPSEAEPTPPVGKTDAEQASKQEQDDLTGRIVDSKGVGIANAMVKRDKSSWTATTNADGRFPLPELKPGEYTLLSITAAGFSSRDCVNINRGMEGDYRPDPKQMVISLLRCATLSGCVLGPDGKPLAGAPLSLDTFNPVGCVCRNYSRAITDNQGRFTIDDVIPGVNVLYYPWSGEPQCEVDSERWKAFIKPGKKYVRLPVLGVCGALDVELQEGQRLDNLTLDLSQSTASVEGRVFAPDGQPLAGALVFLNRRSVPLWGNRSTSLGNISGSHWCDTWRSPETDSKGRFKLHGIGPGRWQLHASHSIRFEAAHPYETVQLTPGQTIHQDIHVTERQDRVNQIARAAAELNAVQPKKQEQDNHTGRIVDSKGVGIANATVKRDKSSWTATTDADGRFPLPELKPGESARLTVSAKGFFPWDENLYRTRATDGEYIIGCDWPIQLARPATLSGRVLGTDGKPLAGSPLSIDTWVDMNHVSTSTGNYKPTATDQQGRFRMEQIPPGSHVIYYPEKQPNRSIPVKGVTAGLIVEPTDGQVINNLVIDLSKCTAGIEGRVLGPDGKPMAGAKVCCSFYHEWDGMSGGSGPIVYTPKTDADGRYKITGISPGQWKLYTSHPRFHRNQSSHILTLAIGKTAHLDLNVTERYDPENQVTRDAAEAERTDDLRKLSRGSFSLGGLPPVDRNLDKFGDMIFLTLSPGQNTYSCVKVKLLGLSPDATPEEVARAAHCGELYFLQPDNLVTINGTIVAPFTPPSGSTGWGSSLRGITRADMVEQIEASRRKNPDADGRRIQVKKGERYFVVRADGKGFLLRIGQVVNDGVEITFMYLGRLRLKATEERKAQEILAAPDPEWSDNR